MTDDAQWLDSTVIRRADDTLGISLDGRQMIRNAELAYHALDGVAAHVWELIESPRTLGDLVAVLTEEYDVAAEDCRRDLLSFLDELGEKLLIGTGAEE